MQWLLIALIPPALYAVSNHIDKFLLSKYFKGGQVGSLVLFSSIFSIIALPIIYFFDRSVMNIALFGGAVLMVNGIIAVISLMCYFYALEGDDASVVVPIYQTIPVISFVLAYFILGEKLGGMEILACVLIVIGTIIISLEFEGKVKLKLRMILLMLASSFLAALSVIIFKFIGVDAGFWTSVFWQSLGEVIFGFLLFVYVSSYRAQFLAVIKKNKFFVLGINSFNETLTLVANIIFSYLSLIAPVAIVATLNGTQPFFVFIFGIIITLFFPKLGKEAIGKTSLIQKFVAIVLISVGTYLIRDKI